MRKPRVCDQATTRMAKILAETIHRSSSNLHSSLDKPESTFMPERSWVFSGLSAGPARWWDSTSHCWTLCGRFVRPRPSCFSEYLAVGLLPNAAMPITHSDAKSCSIEPRAHFSRSASCPLDASAPQRYAVLCGVVRPGVRAMVRHGSDEIPVSLCKRLLRLSVLPDTVETD